jgi:GTP-binding protein HflX
MFRFILIDVVPPNIRKEEAEKNLAELRSLVDTFGGATVVKIIQRRATPDSHTYVGAGKAEELIQIVKEEKIDGVVLNAIVKPGQLFNLQKMLWEVNPHIQVWDRVDLIINIFDKHAHSAEAKLQIKLARMRHMGPRIFGMGMVMSRQGGGIGTRGLGETNTELMKRHWRNEVKKVQEQITRHQREREQQMLRRKELGFKTISIVGYTNAGKTTLFNRLTRKKKKAADELFATLDSNVGNLWMESEKKGLLVSDTIGFIQNLPANLVDAFKSTLMESVHTDLLLHVIDASDPEMHIKIAVVEHILEELGIADKEKMYVFNKIDMLTKTEILHMMEQFKKYNPQFISASENIGFKELFEAIEECFKLK